MPCAVVAWGELQSGKTGELTPPERFADSALAKDILKIAKTIADGTKELKMQRSPHLVLLNLEFYDERSLGMKGGTTATSFQQLS